MKCHFQSNCKTRLLLEIGFRIIDHVANVLVQHEDLIVVHRFEFIGPWYDISYHKITVFKVQDNFFFAWLASAAPWWFGLATIQEKCWSCVVTVSVDAESFNIGIKSINSTGLPAEANCFSSLDWTFDISDNFVLNKYERNISNAALADETSEQTDDSTVRKFDHVLIDHRAV